MHIITFDRHNLLAFNCILMAAAVRGAALEAARALGLGCRPLAEAALDFLVDMLNDDLAAVRD